MMILRRISDGKYYRGAIIWEWCRHRRHAAKLPKHFWEEFVIPKIDCEYELLPEDVKKCPPDKPVD